MKRLGLVASLVAGAGSFALGHAYLGRLEAEVSGGARIAVLVAAKDVPVGSVLSASSVAVRDVPQAYVEARHVRAADVKKVLGARVAGGLKAQETLLWSDLAKFSDQARVLSGLVQHGMRAVAIDSRSADFDGLLRPGDHVDVLFTGGGKGEHSSTVTLLQNLLVLSVGANIVRAEADAANTSSRSGTVTLSATVEQAQTLTQAQLRGRLTLTIRNSDDVTIVDTMPETFGGSLPDPTTKSLLKTSPSKSGGIEHVR